MELWSISVALPHEAKGLMSLMKVFSQTSYGNLRIFEGRLGAKDLILLQTGIGPNNAAKAGRFIIKEFPITHFISTGYCGGLAPDLKTGDGILSNLLICREHPEEEIKLDPAFSGRVKLKLDKLNFSVYTGPMLSSPQPMLDPKDKESFGKKTGALAVDMESYYLLKALQENKKIASFALRFVVDGMKDDLLDTQGFIDEKSGFKPMDFAKELIKKPRILLKLPNLERQAKLARKHLTQAVSKIFDLK